MAKATGAPVYCPEIEVPVLADIMSFVPWPGFGPYESYDADETVSGGERLELAGLEIDVLFTPGHSPGHVTYAVYPEGEADGEGAVPHSSRAMSSSRARSAAPTFPAAIGERCSRASARLSTPIPRRRSFIPATWESPHWAPSALESVPGRARSIVSPRDDERVSGPSRDFRRPARHRPHADLYAAASAGFGRAGYGRIEIPAFEDTELFSRGIGEATDIVRKEMFTFEDLGGRSLTLRPEGTAPICRAYVEHGMHVLPQPVKLWYWGSYFRHERPQAGRYRQFWQLGAEAIGSDSPLVDAELIILLDELLQALGVEGVKLRLSSLGSAGTRASTGRSCRRTCARTSLSSRATSARIDANPLRAFDSDDEGTKSVMVAAPTMLDRLADEDAQHLARPAPARPGGCGVHSRRLARSRPRLLHPHRVRVRLGDPAPQSPLPDDQEQDHRDE